MQSLGLHLQSMHCKWKCHLSSMPPMQCLQHFHRGNTSVLFTLGNWSISCYAAHVIYMGCQRGYLGHYPTFYANYLYLIGILDIMYVVHSISFQTFFVQAFKIKGVQEEIPSEASTLQIGSVAFPLGQYTSPQLHPCHRLFDQDGHQDSSSPSLSSDLAPCDFCLFSKLKGCCYETIEEMKEAVTKVIDMLTQEDFHGAFQKLLERYNKWIAAGGDYFEGD